MIMSCSKAAKFEQCALSLTDTFSHLTYGDQGQRAVQISAKLGQDDLLSIMWLSPS